MASWFEKYSFVDDPYERQDPYNIDLKQIKWNRKDLPNERIRITQFVEDAANGKRTSLKIFGSYGSGKTWLTRIIERELLDKFDNKRESIAFLYTKVPRTEPTFQIVFRLVMQYFLEHNLENVAKHMKDPQQLPEWETIFSNADFAKCCRNYYNKNNEILTRRWLIGDKLTAAELGKLFVNSSLSSDYDRFEMLQKLCKNLSKIFSTTILVVDELENADVKLAAQLADALRDLLDLIYDRFVLICSFTAQKEEEWYDVGYSESLSSRLDHTTMVKNLDKETLEDFLRLHHEMYRKPGYTDDQLLPFNKDGIMEVYDQTPAGKRVPRYFFQNCRDVVRAAELKDKKVIDASFVSENSESLSNRK